MIKAHHIIEDWMQIRHILSRPLPSFYDQRRRAGSLMQKSYKWDMDCGWDKAVLMANNEGWPEGAALVKNLSDKYINNLSHLEYIQQYVYDVEGLTFDVGLLMQGEPEHWIRREDTDEVSKRNGKLYNVVINIGASSSVPSDYIVRRGAAAAAVVSLIEYAGLSCRLTTTDFVVNHKGTCESRVDLTLKRHGEPLDIDRLALAAVHPVGLRRIFFRVNELLNTDAMRKGMPYYVATRSYGVPADLPDLSGIDVYAPTMRATKKTVLDAPFSCDIKTEGWIKQQLVKLGVVGV